MLSSLSKFSRFDTFARAHTHIQVRTTGGAVLSVLTIATMVILMISEFTYYTSKRLEHHLMVDTSQGDRDFTIELDVSFHSCKCKDIELHMEDTKGMRYEDALVRVSRLDIGTEGCRMNGYMRVKRVGGSFSFVGGHVNPAALQFMMMPPPEMLSYNLSHTIHSLTFGPAFPGQLRPLDGVAGVSPNYPGQWQYHLKLVPTMFEGVSGRVTDSEQFSATDFMNVIDVSRGILGQPGVWFRYEFSPIMVRIVETRESFFSFLVSVCALLGGVFTVSGIIDQVLYRTMETRKTK